MARKKGRKGSAVRVKGYSYTRHGKTVHVTGYSRKKPKK